MDRIYFALFLFWSSDILGFDGKQNNTKADARGVRVNVNMTWKLVFWILSSACNKNIFVSEWNINIY